MAKPIAVPPGWRIEDRRLRCKYQFADFVQAMTFLTEVAHAAERRKHHPDFAVHWNQVDFTVWSHDVNDLTSRDEGLAEEIHRISMRHGAKPAKEPRRATA